MFVSEVVVGPPRADSNRESHKKFSSARPGPTIRVEISLQLFQSKMGGGRPFRKMVNIFAYMCPNRSGVGAINNPDRSEQVFDAYYISEVSKKIFMDDISIVRP